MTEASEPVHTTEAALAPPESRAAKARRTRLETSTPKERRAAACKAAHARWNRNPAPSLSLAASRKGSQRTAHATTSAFGKALSAAESRLAAALQERAFHTAMTAALEAEIPSLVRTINALKNTQEAQVAPSVVPVQVAAALAEVPSALTPGGPRLTRAQGAAMPVSLAEPEDEDQFLREDPTGATRGGQWH